MNRLYSIKDNDFYILRNIISSNSWKATFKLKDSLIVFKIKKNNYQNDKVKNIY